MNPTKLLLFPLLAGAVSLSACNAVGIAHTVATNAHSVAAAVNHQLQSPTTTSGTIPPSEGSLEYSTAPATQVQPQPAPGSCHALVLDTNAGYYLPDPHCTPGALNPAVTQATLPSTICRSGGYTGSIRPTESITGQEKRASESAYGESYSRTTEYDHFIPLELGGADNSSLNLWPEPNSPTATSFRNPKDSVENALHSAVCSGQVTLAHAQHALATNWTTAESTLHLK